MWRPATACNACGAGGAAILPPEPLEPGRRQFGIAHRVLDVPVLTFGVRPLSAPDGREGVIVLANIAGLTTQKLKELASNPNVLSAGKLILGRMNRP